MRNFLRLSYRAGNGIWAHIMLLLMCVMLKVPVWLGHPGDCPMIWSQHVNWSSRIVAPLAPFNHGVGYRCDVRNAPLVGEEIATLGRLRDISGKASSLCDRQ